MSSWKSYLFAFFVIAIVDQINTTPPDIRDEIKIKSSIGSKYGLSARNDPPPETTTTEDPTTTTKGPTTTTEKPTKSPTTTTESPAHNEFAKFTLVSTGSKQYKVKEAALEHGKWWLGSTSNPVSENHINTLTFGNWSPLTIGGIPLTGSSEGVKGRFKIKNLQGLVALVVDFEVVGKKQPKIALSGATSCSGGPHGDQPNIIDITCD
ncbi:uncharacterized protein LOC135835367 [Planococcus citri]|uniref:uncharacterized protein LOC135835367 n=1 Tax=Planococcus citri TaxID=170843 RepID=UPI0031FA454B